MNAIAAPKSSAQNRLEGFALTAVLQGLPTFAAAALVLKVMGAPEIVGERGGAAVYVVLASLVYAALTPLLAANLPVAALKNKSAQTSLKASRGGGKSGSRVHKPDLDEMHGPESLPFRPGGALPAKPFGTTSRIIQPTDSRQSGPEFGPSARSSGGAPGKRGGWKKR